MGADGAGSPARERHRTALSPRTGRRRFPALRLAACATAGAAALALGGCGTSGHVASAQGALSAQATSKAHGTSTSRTSTSHAHALRVRRRPAGPSYPVLSSLGTPGPRWRAVVTVHHRIAAWVAMRDGVTMLRFDQRVVHLVLHAGSVDPGVGHWRYGDSIRGRERGQLVAAFNAGFRLSTGAGGWFSYGHTAVPLIRGRASVVTYRDGVTDVGSWGDEVPARKPVASVRQNLVPLIDHGVAASTVGDCVETCWGATVGGVLSVARSAIGVDRQGRLIYGAIASAEPATLAQGMIDGGVVRAAELDINPDWVAAYLYRHSPHTSLPAFVPVIPGQYGVYGHFLIPYSRDFFAVLAR